MSVRVHFLGTSPLVTPDRYQTATVVQTPEGLAVIDTAEPCAASMIRQGLSLDDIRHVLVTHWHGDHQSGLQSLLLQMRRQARVHLPVSQQVVDWIEGARKAYMWPNLPSPHVTLELLRVGKRIDLGKLSIQAFENDHLWHHLDLWKEYQLHREQIGAFSFAMRYGNIRIVYSGDLGTLGEEVQFWKLLDEPADLVVLEAGHILPMQTLLQELKDKPIRFLAFNHTYLEVISEKALQEFFQKNLTFPVIVTKDGQWVELEEGPGGQVTTRTGMREDLPGRLMHPKYLTVDERGQKFAAKGIPPQWRILGPFANPKDADGQFPGLWENHGALDDHDFSRTYRGVDGAQLQWKTITLEDLPDDGRVPFDWIYGGIERLAYAVTDVEAPAAGDYRILFGSDDGMRMWVDGREVYCLSAERGTLADTENVVVHLDKGMHQITVAVEQRYGSWMLWLRMIPATAER